MHCQWCGMLVVCYLYTVLCGGGDPQFVLICASRFDSMGWARFPVKGWFDESLFKGRGWDQDRWGVRKKVRPALRSTPWGWDQMSGQREDFDNHVVEGWGWDRGRCGSSPASCMMMSDVRLVPFLAYNVGCGCLCVLIIQPTQLQVGVRASAHLSWSLSSTPSSHAVWTVAMYGFDRRNPISITWVLVPSILY